MVTGAARARTAPGAPEDAAASPSASSPARRSLRGVTATPGAHCVTTCDRSQPPLRARKHGDRRVSLSVLWGLPSACHAELLSLIKMPRSEQSLGQPHIRVSDVFKAKKVYLEFGSGITL